MKTYVVILILIGLCLPAARQAAAFEAGGLNLNSFLTSVGRFSDIDIGEISRGNVVAKLLRTSEQREMAVVGVVRVSASRNHFLAMLRDIERFKQSSEVLEIGKLSARPIPRDFERLNLDAEDVDSLRGCNPGDCRIKLPAGAIERLKRELDPSSPDYGARATALFRKTLLDYTNDYLATGNAALVQYADRRSPVSLETEFRSLLDQSTYLRELAPEFSLYLERFPQGKPPNAEDFVYWSKESFGLKPVISLTHVTIHQRVNKSASVTLAASKQIYASHYFDASLGVTLFFEQESDSVLPGTYLVYLNRSRVDALGGGFSKLKRAIIGTDLRAGLERSLRVAKRKLETKLTPR
jgi:hypothetical protein